MKMFNEIVARQIDLSEPVVFRVLLALAMKHDFSAAQQIYDEYSKQLAKIQQVVSTRVIGVYAEILGVANNDAVRVFASFVFLSCLLGRFFALCSVNILSIISRSSIIFGTTQRRIPH
jgi:hypothetical protein